MENPMKPKEIKEPKLEQPKVGDISVPKQPTQPKMPKVNQDITREKIMKQGFAPNPNKQISNNVDIKNPKPIPQQPIMSETEQREKASQLYGMDLTKKPTKPKSFTISYMDLPITLLGRGHRETFDSPAYREEEDVEKDYDYEADPNEVGEVLAEQLYKEGIFNDDTTNDDIDQYIYSRWDELTDKYESEIMDHFEERAKEAATEHYQQEYDDGYYW